MTRTIIKIMDVMQSFIYNAAPSRVIFGSGSLQKLGEELSRQKLTAPLLLSTPQQVEHANVLKKNLDGNIAGIFTEATMHTPTNVTDKALEYANSVKADSIVSIGGGSTIGLGKAISIRTGLPHICIPTTYAGSEMTPILGETADGVKKTRTDPKILPGTVIYDVDLTMTLPVGLSATSGVNAIAHSGMFPDPKRVSPTHVWQWKHFMLKTQTQSSLYWPLRELRHLPSPCQYSSILPLTSQPVRLPSMEHGFAAFA